MLRDGMMAGLSPGYEEITWNGRVYRYFVNWVLDNKQHSERDAVFQPVRGRPCGHYAPDAEKSDGMIWSNVNKGEGDYHYYETAYTPLGYFLP